MSSEEKNLKVVAIVQARTGSTRLPEKIFKELSGKPMLWHVVNRLSQSGLINQIVIATTVLSEDDKVQQFSEYNNYSFYRGSSDDVLSRYYEASKYYHADIVVRITADCPVIDPALIDTMLKRYLAQEKSTRPDYFSNVLERTFPRGLDTEIFSYDTLARAHREAILQPEREHVTPYIYNHPDKFIIKNFSSEKDLSFHRWTVDTPEDFLLIEKIYSSLYKKNPLFLFDDILRLFEEKPDLFEINQNVQQKKSGE